MTTLCKICGDPLRAFDVYHVNCAREASDSGERFEHFHKGKDARMLDSLLGRLRAVLDEWTEDVFADRGESEDEQARDSGEWELAESTVRMALTLRRPEDFVQMEGHRSERREMTDMWSYEGRNDLRRAPRVLVLVAKDALGKVTRARERVLELATIATYVQLSARASDYLHRVAELYVWGFDQELYAFARSVLEAALEDVVEDVGGKSRARLLLSKSPESRLDLYDLITVCGPRYLHMLSAESVRNAHAIRKDGNDVLHEVAFHSLRHESALIVIQRLCEVLADAFPEGRDDRGLPLNPIPLSPP